MDKERNAVLWLLLLGVALITGTQCVQWAPATEDHTVLYACTQGTLSLQWAFLLDPGDAIDTIQWFFDGRSQEMIATYAHGRFFPTPVFTDRVSQNANAGINVNRMQVLDSGNYSVEVIVRSANGDLISLNRSVIVHVTDHLQTNDGRLHATQLPLAEYDKQSNQYHIVLTCGTFFYTTNPPFQITWLTSSGNNRSSTRYQDGQFQLLLPNPLEPGSYTCQVPQTVSCSHGDQSSNAVVTVDRVESRLAVMEAELNDLKAREAYRVCTSSSVGETFDCSNVKQCDASSGVRELHGKGLTFWAFCDQTTDGGGWTLLVNRQDGSVDFNRTWQQYEDGFGDKTGEYWLGLRYIHALTNSSVRQFELRVDIGDWNGSTAYAVYNVFRVDGPDTHYVLHVTGYNGTAGDSLNGPRALQVGTVQNGMSFSTYDGPVPGQSTCAQNYHSGWWHRPPYCFYASATGVYGSIRDNLCQNYCGMMWFEWHQDDRAYKTMSMKIRPVTSP